MKIIVYGLGLCGIKFIHDIIEFVKGIEIIALTDSDTSRFDISEYKITCISPTDIQSHVFDYVIVTPQKYYDEIKHFLFKLGITEEKIKTIREIEEIHGGLYCNLCRSRFFDWTYIEEEQEIFH